MTDREYTPTTMTDPAAPLHRIRILPIETGWVWLCDCGKGSPVQGTRYRANARRGGQMHLSAANRKKRSKIDADPTPPTDAELVRKVAEAINPLPFDPRMGPNSARAQKVVLDQARAALAVIEAGRASLTEPKPDERQVQYSDGEWSREIEIHDVPEPQPDPDLDPEVAKAEVRATALREAAEKLADGGHLFMTRGFVTSIPLNSREGAAAWLRFEADRIIAAASVTKRESGDGR